MTPDNGFRRQPWRRIAAFGVDYIVILVFIGAQIAWRASQGGLEMPPPDMSTDARLALQFNGFLWTTLPVFLYFTLCESVWGRTLGKRIAGLRVDGTPGRIALRNALKFLPWEIAHTGLWHGWTVPLFGEPGPIALVLMSVANVLIAIYLASLFIGAGRTPYDRLSRTSVRPHLTKR